MRKLLSGTIFLSIIACLLWSSAFVGIKIGLHYQSVFQFAGFRFTLSGIFLYIYFGKSRKYWEEVRNNWKFIGLVALLQTVVQYMCFYSGINLLPASIAAILVGSGPLFVAIIAHFTFNDDKIDRLKLVSLFLGIAGVAVISLGRNSLPKGMVISLWGIVLLLMNNLVSGWSNVLVAKNNKRVSPVVLSSSTLLFGGLALILISFPIEGWGLHDVAPAYFLSLGWLSFLSAAAFAIWFTLLQRPGVKVSDLNMWKFLVPLSGAILGWCLMPNESPNTVSVIGVVIIAMSLVILNYSNRRKQRKLIAAQKKS